MSIGERIAEVLSGALDISPDQIGDTFSPEDTDKWTSLAHLTVIMALEEEFGVAFSDEEAVELLSVSVIRNTLASKGVV